MEETQDLNIRETAPLLAPAKLKAQWPLDEAAAATVVAGRGEIRRILAGEDRRLLVVAGPCSIHDEAAALEYARRLLRLREVLRKELCIVMRVYFEKPRTTVGWKGLISDPHMDGSEDVVAGLQAARKLLLAINSMGVPCATEVLDPIVPQYLADLISWAAIGARTTESQTHREMASGLSMPVGFKNNTEGNLQVAINAMESARSPHGFLGIDHEGRTCLVRTRGNAWGHLVLRGGEGGPNYYPECIEEAMDMLQAVGERPNIFVDCSHANSGKKYQRQERVWRAVLEQRLEGNDAIIGMMLESHLEEGKQSVRADLKGMRYGVSVTDECIGWDKTQELLEVAYEALEQPVAEMA